MNSKGSLKALAIQVLARKQGVERASPKRRSDGCSTVPVPGSGTVEHQFIPYDSASMTRATKLPDEHQTGDPVAAFRERILQSEIWPDLDDVVADADIAYANGGISGGDLDFLCKQVSHRANVISKHTPKPEAHA